MPITIHYETLLKRAAGTESELVDIEEPCEVRALVHRLAVHHGDPLAALLVDDDGAVRPSVLIFVDQRQVAAEGEILLRDGDVVTLMSPISGG